MAGGTFDVELLSEGKSTGAFIALRCEMVATHSKLAIHSGALAKPADRSMDKEVPSIYADIDAGPEKSTSVEHHPKTEGSKIVCVTVGKGQDFRIDRMLWKHDIPDDYCKIQFGSNPTVWRTAIVRNNV